MSRCDRSLPDTYRRRRRGRLRDTVGGFDEYLAAGRLRLIGRDEWHGDDETFDVARIAALWAGLIDEALVRGFDGMRASGDAFWLANRQPDEVLRYEHEIAGLLAGKRALVLCTYDLTASRGIDVLDIARLHHLTVARRRGDWQPFENPRRARPTICAASTMRSPCWSRTSRAATCSPSASGWCCRCWSRALRARKWRGGSE